MKTWGSSQSEYVKGNGAYQEMRIEDSNVGNMVLLQEGKDLDQGYWGKEWALIVSTFHCRDVHHIPSFPSWGLLVHESSMPSIHG
jgi:hypothetical protein